MQQIVFSLEQCNQALALVRPIVRDIVEKMNTIEKIQRKTSKVGNNPPEATDLLAELQTAKKLLQEIEHHVQELTSVGVIPRDLSIGLVDFPGNFQRNSVFFCWMLGEQTVEHWHTQAEGFAQRKNTDMAAHHVA